MSVKSSPGQVAMFEGGSLEALRQVCRGPLERAPGLTYPLQLLLQGSQRQQETTGGNIQAAHGHLSYHRDLLTF